MRVMVGCCNDMPSQGYLDRVVLIELPIPNKTANLLFIRHATC